MNGDLSLAQSLGGLRVTNPDTEALQSPTSPPSSSESRPPPPSSHSSQSTVTDSRQPDLSLPSFEHEAGSEGSSLDFNPDSYNLQVANDPPQHALSGSPSTPSNNFSSSRLNHRSSMGFGPQAQQTGQYPAHPAAYHNQLRNPNVQDPSLAPRPISAMYSQMNNSSSSGMSLGSTYRYRDDVGSSDGSLGGLTRSGSRAARQMMGQVPQRELSRSYRQPATPMNGGNVGGPLPPRRDSRRARAPTGSSTATGGYDGVDQPYAGSAPVPRPAEEWRERAAATGTQREADASGQTQSRLVKKGPKDFNFGRTLGEGSYSTVLAATDRQNLKEYAIKVLDKRHIIKEKKVKYVNIERDTLNRLTEHPGIVRLYYTFQDERSLYFVLDLASGGELLGVLKKMGSFDIECTRFYGAEILDSISYMHSRGVIHRDLKPENVLLDRDMHVKITDFGTAKILPDPRANNIGETSGDPTDGAETDRAVSFVGTAEYVSPELLRDKNACKASDLWAFGCIIYQLLAGRPPFKAANEYLTFQKILALDYTFPDGFPDLARDLVERLLVLEPANRLPVEHIRTHRFFEGVQWGKALWRQKAPRLKPYVPPPAEPIRLNGLSKSKSNGSANALANMGAAAAMNNAAATTTQQSQAPARRPQLQNVTELPPPSQLDLEWAPVLTHNNERILKLGNLVVAAVPQASSPNGKNGEPQTPVEKPKFSRFFSSNTTKRRERLVLITSAARLVVAAAGGNEKKSKMEINLAANGSTCKSCMDGKGLTYWSLGTRDKQYMFEDPRATTSDPAGSKYSTQEWLDAVEQAREVAMATSMTNSYSEDSTLNDLRNTSNKGSASESVGGDAVMPLSGPSAGERHNLRHTLRRNTDDEASLKGRKRFSKRHSKSGLAAVF
ncbi:Serine threonine- kinase PKH1 [Lecanosticta acicola]|uniref:non-specific serine/threonine protein kinase n=1 Tax=Lecanosticta acicola TaxID=111012 RepID=A0AAI9E9M6_9PEZI|nr:Serine threonine- kinase PKH1 [Lecanosticta acicola]